MADDPTSWGALPAESPEAWGAKPIAPPEPPATFGSMAKQVAAGIPAGIIGTAGTLADIYTGRGLTRAALGPFMEVVPPSTEEAISHSLPAALDPVSYPARNVPERVARGVGAALPWAISPGAGIAETAANLVTQGVAGGTGALAEEYVPNWAKPIAGFVGGLAGGVGAAGTIAAGRVAGQQAKRMAEPFTRAGQERTAAQSYFGSAEDLPATRTALEAGAPELIPGSTPTTGQVTGDMGLLARERGLETVSPVPFQQRRAEQNAARRTALGEVQPIGAPEDVANAFRARLGEIDAETQGAIDRATSEAQGRAAGLGGDLPPEVYGESIRGAIEPRVEAQRGAVRQAVGDLGGQTPPETSGMALRGALDNAEQQARVNERSLWRAVDPGGNLTYGMQPIQAAHRTVYGDLTKAAEATMTPAERTIAQLIGDFKPVEPFREMTDLRSLVSSAMRQEIVTNGRTPAYTRLSRFRGAIEDDINNAVANRVQAEAEAVARGQIAPGETMAARIQEQVNAWRASRDAGRSAEASAAGAPAGGTATVRPGLGEPSARAGEPGAAPSDQGISPTWDAAAAERLAAATGATRERAQTFNAPAIKPLLRREGQEGPFRMGDAAVAQRVFAAGAGGGETVANYLAAVGNSGGARASLVDHVVSNMRRAAERPDGTIDPAKFAAWRRQYGEALRAFPDLDARMQNVARASGLVQAMDPIGRSTSAELPRQFFRPGETGGDGVRSLRGLIGDERAIPILSDYAAATARKAAQLPDGTIDPKKLTAWQKSHADALRELPPEVSGRFATAAKATEAIRDAQLARKAALDAYQEGAIGRVMKAGEGADVTRAAGGIFGSRDAATQMGRLATEARPNPAAWEGLRKAIIDHITNRFVSNTEAGTSGITGIKSDMFQSFLRQNRAALGKVFNPAEMGRLDAIAADLQRANRSVTAVKLPGRSNTAQDIRLAAAAGGETPSVFARIVGSVVGRTGAAIMGAIEGALGKQTGDAIRGIGIGRIDDLIREMALNPDFAKVMMSKLPGAKVSPNIGAQFAQRVLRATASSGVDVDEKRQHRATGGRAWAA